MMGQFRSVSGTLFLAPNIAVWRIPVTMTRRRATQIIGGASAGLAFGAISLRAAESALIQRAIPSTGEKLPVIGMGTSRTFDVGPGERKALADVLQAFARGGARLVDSSPMYGRAEEVVGDLANQLNLRDSLFLATKVWTHGREAGLRSLERSLQLLRTSKIDLVQIHNLVDTETQLATLRAWKEQGKIRYLGVTHYDESAFPELEKVLRQEKLDFVQFNYSIGERAAEQTILPLAQEKGVATLINRPFARGDLLRRVKDRPLPDFARDFDCTSWAQFLLKWIVAHPAVTCVIPATSNPSHLADNLAGGRGRLPGAEMRARMIEALGTN